MALQSLHFKAIFPKRILKYYIYIYLCTIKIVFIIFSLLSLFINILSYIFYLLSQGVQTSGLITVFAIKLCPLADFVFKVYPPIFGLGLKIPSESDPDVRASIFGADGYNIILILKLK